MEREGGSHRARGLETAIGMEMIPLGYEGPFFAIGLERQRTYRHSAGTECLVFGLDGHQLAGERARGGFGLDGVCGYGSAEVHSQSRHEKSSVQKTQMQFFFAMNALSVKQGRTPGVSDNTM